MMPGTGSAPAMAAAAAAALLLLLPTLFCCVPRVEAAAEASAQRLRPWQDDEPEKKNDAHHVMRSHRRRPVVLTVDQSGKGDYTTIQKAINAVPAHSSGALINIKPGTYREKVVVNKTKVSLVGTSATSTIVTWNAPWIHTSPFEIPLYVQASDFVAKRITFQNTFGKGHQAVAARVSGDKAAFYDCRFLSYQDTLLDETGRHYYHGCYIQGATDFIFGAGKAFFESCHLHSISDGHGAFTAHGRQSRSEDTGFSFVRCHLTGIGVGKCILGRPWRSYARVVFALCSISNTVDPVGWNDWNHPEFRKTAFFGQFQCNGQGSGTNGRADWAHSHLTRDEAAPFLTNGWVDGQHWLRPH